MKHFLKEWGVFTVIILFFTLLRIFVWFPVKVDGHSMDPNLSDKQQLIVLKTASIDRNDVVVAQEETTDGSSKYIVKRVVGMPGDTIRYENDNLYINDTLTTEEYIQEYLDAFKNGELAKEYSYNEAYQNLANLSAAFTTDSEGRASFSIELGDDEYLLLGDNRLVSRDSRDSTVGAFDSEDIIGEAIFRFWPFDAIGNVD